RATGPPPLRFGRALSHFRNSGDSFLWGRLNLLRRCPQKNLSPQQGEHLVHDHPMLERELSVDRDDRDARAEALEQPGVARDVHLLEVELLLAADASETFLRDVAEVAPCLRVEHDAAALHGPT